MTQLLGLPLYGRAFGFERAMDTLGAIVGPLTALWLLAAFPGNYRVVFCVYIIARCGGGSLDRFSR